MFHNIMKIGTTAFIGLAMVQPAFAGEAKFSQGLIKVEPTQRIFNATLMVSGPNGYYTEEFTERGLPEVNLQQFGKLEDGLYRWQITGATDKKRVIHKSELYSGRDKNAKSTRNIGLREMGVFYVKDGQIMKIDPDLKEPEQENKGE